MLLFSLKYSFVVFFASIWVGSWVWKLSPAENGVMKNCVCLWWGEFRHSLTE